MMNVDGRLGREATSAGGQRRDPGQTKQALLANGHEWAQMGTNTKLCSGGGQCGHACALGTSSLLV